MKPWYTTNLFEICGLSICLNGFIVASSPYYRLKCLQKAAFHPTLSFILKSQRIYVVALLPIQLCFYRKGMVYWKRLDSYSYYRWNELRHSTGNFRMFASLAKKSLLLPILISIFNISYYRIIFNTNKTGVNSTLAKIRYVSFLQKTENKDGIKHHRKSRFKRISPYYLGVANLGCGMVWMVLKH